MTRGGADARARHRCEVVGVSRFEEVPMERNRLVSMRAAVNAGYASGMSGSRLRARGDEVHGGFLIV